MRTEPAASRQPTMPRLAFNRKDMRRRIDWQGTPQQPPTPPEDAFSVALSWAEAALARVGSRNRGSHRLIIGSTTAFRRNPGDVAVRILHVAGFAVDTILRVDDEARPGRLLDPFIDAGRAIAVGRAGIDIVLGRLLQVHVRDLEMNRLVLFLIGVGKEPRRQLVEDKLAVRLRALNRPLNVARGQR